MATIPRGIARSRQISKCLACLRLDGFVGGHHQHQQIDAAAPASMLRTKRSWPGTLDEAETHAIDVQEGESQIKS